MSKLIVSEHPIQSISNKVVTLVNRLVRLVVLVTFTEICHCIFKFKSIKIIA